jgi:hypothetical protein
VEVSAGITTGLEGLSTKLPLQSIQLLLSFVGLREHSQLRRPINETSETIDTLLSVRYQSLNMLTYYRAYPKLV